MTLPATLAFPVRAFAVTWNAAPAVARIFRGVTETCPASAASRPLIRPLTGPEAVRFMVGSATGP